MAARKIKLDRQLIIECKDCGHVMHAGPDSKQAKSGRCWNCREAWRKENYREFIEAMSPEEVKHRKKMAKLNASNRRKKLYLEKLRKGSQQRLL